MREEVLDGLWPSIVALVVDDMAALGTDAPNFLLNLRAIFTRLRLKRCRLKAKKCKFGYSEVDFAGHIVSGAQHYLSADRKQGIKSMKIPTNVTQLRAFIGAVNYFRQFIPHLGEILAPLTALTGKNTKFAFDKGLIDRFHEVKL